MTGIRRAVLASLAVVGALASGLIGTAQEPTKSKGPVTFNFDLFYLQKRNMFEAFAPGVETEYLHNGEVDKDVRERIKAMDKKNEVFLVTAVFTDKNGVTAPPAFGRRSPRDIIKREGDKDKFVINVALPGGVFLDGLSEVDFEISAKGFKPVILKGLYPETKELKVVMPLDKAPPGIQPEMCLCPEFIHLPPCPATGRHRLFRR